jgi:hypothetical protein
MNEQTINQTAWEVFALGAPSPQRWSQHASEKLAVAAAKRYRRKNTDTASWVDHYGYLVVGPDGTEITIR